MTDYNKKDVNPSDDEVTFKAASNLMYDFFFPGSGKWKPVTVRAESREVAQQLWEKYREPVAEIRTEENPVDKLDTNE